MKHLIVLTLSILSIGYGQAQINELGVFLGGSNFVGDVGATNFISPSQFAIGGIYKWNRSKRHSYRLSAIFTELQGIDNKSEDPRRIQRGYEFSNGIIEIAAGIEFTFIDFDLHSGARSSTPYLFGGISAAHHDDTYFVNGVQTQENTSSWTMGIPMGLGFKSNFLGDLVFAIEIGARYTFSDGLDGSLPKKQNLQQYRFGNINNNDWYVFSGITLTYTFGENPCYCVN
ncbi:type IX secretion system protein PorG [Gaetbulibacter saemankumensis]|uniref:type IX secretion system protein PorG n=1 Tax=Gaetbulibacter saemankumensis TaxID=311208 RepID=UPI0004864C1E|nr:DUF6089 family protein [Gaetbulibacter saemankumensis]